MEWKEELGATGRLASLKPWTQTHRRYHGISATERVLTILDCVTMSTLGGSQETSDIMKSPNANALVESAMQHILVDVSQNPCRRAFSNMQEVSKCMHTASIIYSFRKDRVLLPFEMMMIHGHSMSMQVPNGMTPKELHDLAGMGINLPCLGLILASLMLSTGIR